MSQFADKKNELNIIREKIDQESGSLRGIRERIRAIDREAGKLSRTAAADDRRIIRLRDERTGRVNEITRIKNSLERLQLQEKALLNQFADLATPGEQIKNLDDNSPLLLMPVRLETVFQKPDPDRGIDDHELLVRFFPDDIFIETHEKGLTHEEYEDALNYWIEIWKAAGNYEKELAAWKALVPAYGPYRASYLIKVTRPVNEEDKPLEPVPGGAEPGVLPELPTVELKEDSWNQAPVVTCLPDYFIVMGYREGKREVFKKCKPITSPLFAGPDPSSEEDEGIRQEDGEIKVDRDIQWLVDFQDAVDKGMGTRIKLNLIQGEQGFDRIIVAGLRFSMDKDESVSKFEALLENHQYADDGLAFLPNGTPTNNTENANSGFESTMADDETIFSLITLDKQFDEEPGSWLEKSDAVHFCELLSLNPSKFQKILNAGKFDNRDSLAMNKALWPATLGYFLDEMMDPLIGEQDIAATKEFFLNHVSARGLLPSFRAGNQPYGIYAATSFKRLDFEGPANVPRDNGKNLSERISMTFFGRLKALLNKMDSDWENMVKKVSFIGKEGDQRQILLDILGLHAASVDYYQRYCSGPGYMTNYLNMVSTNVASVDWNENFLNKLEEIKSALGLDWKEDPAILKKVFYSVNTVLNGGIVDDRPLSETAAIREYSANNENYIQWMLNSTLDVIARQDFGENKTAPAALLYLLLRHAVMQAYNQTSNSLFRETDHNFRPIKESSEYLYLGEQVSGHSKWQYLYNPEPRITGNASTLVGEYISGIAGKYVNGIPVELKPSTGQLTEVLDSLKVLQDLPTAVLERLTAEHIDLCSYRLDAWKTGFTNLMLYNRRFMGEGSTDEVTYKPGFYLGAYGWLEDVRPGGEPERKPLSDVPDEFREMGDLYSDPSNAGYIHAPSLNHAVTASVLRNAQLSNRDDAGDSEYAVNLSSERVRRALNIIDGINNGQELGALLGYQFERGLHDKYGLAELDKFIYPLRKKFPLVGDKLSGSGDSVPIEAIEARNVLNGVDFIDHIRESNNSSYPFGFEDLPEAGQTEMDAIGDEVLKLMDTMDAIGDLGLAEGVFQVVRGNYDRAGAMSKAISEGSNPPEPEIVNTPRSGFVVNHRVGLHFETGIDYTDPSSANPFHGIIDFSPRAQAEPGLNKWLSQVLPDPDNIRIIAGHPVSDADPSVITSEVTVAGINLQPVDLIYIFDKESSGGNSEIDRRIAWFIRSENNLGDDAEISVKYTQRGEGWDSSVYTLFELTPLLNHLNALITGARTLTADDVVLPNEGSEDAYHGKGYDKTELVTRMSHIAANFKEVIDNLGNAIADLKDDAAPVGGLFDAVRKNMIALSCYGLTGSFPEKSANDKDVLLEQAERVYIRALENFNSFDEMKDDTGTGEEVVNSYVKAAGNILGPDYKVIPQIRLHNAGEFSRSYSDHTHILRDNMEDFPVEEWLNGLSKVRGRMYNLQQAVLLAETVNSSSLALTPVQLPYIEDDNWLALQYAESYQIDTDKLLYTFHHAGTFSATKNQSALLIDEWTELIPSKQETTGLSFNYNKPNAEPPQTLLLAVSPNITGSWQLDDLEAILNETLDDVKKRAVEPDIIDDTAYAQFLPSIMMAVTRRLITISTDLAVNNVHVHNLLKNE